jgi:hypothetical protein
MKTRSALLELNMLTGPCHLADWLTDWTDPCNLLNCLEPDPRVDTARNNTCFVVIVGYHGNPVYRAVGWVPIYLSVTWLPKFLTCGRFPWEAPTTQHPRQTSNIPWLINCRLYKPLSEDLTDSLFHWSSASVRQWNKGAMVVSILDCQGKAACSRCYDCPPDTATASQAVHTTDCGNNFVYKYNELISICEDDRKYWVLTPFCLALSPKKTSFTMDPRPKESTLTICCMFLGPWQSGDGGRGFHCSALLCGHCTCFIFLCLTHTYFQLSEGSRYSGSGSVIYDMAEWCGELDILLYVAYLCYCIVTQVPYQVTLLNTSTILKSVIKRWLLIWLLSWPLWR